jgi:transposase-like protein
MVQEADSRAKPGQIGALLRREGLYSSTLSTWRRQRARGELTGVSPVKRGPKIDEAAHEIEKLKRENERLRKKLDQAETIIDVQKKRSKVLGLEEERQKQVNHSSR